MATTLRKTTHEVAQAASPVIVYRNPILIRPSRGRPSTEAYAAVGQSDRGVWLSLHARRLIGMPRWVTVHADVVERVIIVRPAEAKTPDTWSISNNGSIGGGALVSALVHYGFNKGRYSVEYRDGALLLRPQTQGGTSNGQVPH